MPDEYLLTVRMIKIKMTMDKISIAIWAILYYKLNLEN
ncbi:hypothetical protein M23134_03038 [Microscilla marina ATCC 23134]|uniref:Uncharacterized protein n=1 Tax=Microscilla marina ATCC 23134 TaxID=313606 RepID=A1ZZ83_MICM2|nr:hypothetical protein M23134_03038 [Microscilla marina ATCC 23134]